MHCVAFSDIDPFRRSAALKSTEFRLANKLENRSRTGKKVLSSSEVKKKILEKILSILNISHKALFTHKK